MNTKRKGFIVIEIVIISIITVVLGAVIFFMNSDADSSAQASRIISNFRNMKTAAVAWQQDNHGHIRQGSHNRHEILKYLKSRTPLKLADDSGEQGSYMLRLTDDGKSLYIGYELDDNNGIKRKLTAKAEAAELLGSDMKSMYNNDSQVWMQVLSTEG